MTTPPQPSLARLKWEKRIAAWLIFWICNLLRLSYRIRYYEKHHRDAAKRLHPQASYGLALWHEHAFTSICGHTHMGIMPMVSLSDDGEYITYLLHRLGFYTARGSSSRGGSEARAELMAAIARGTPTAITVDGPRGPRHRVKAGVIAIAREAKTPIVPVVGLASSYWEFKSWDRFKLPKPWATIWIVYGKPIVIDEATTGVRFGEAKSRLGSALREVEDKARLLASGKATPEMLAGITR